MTEERMRSIMEIVKRASKLNLLMFDTISLFMDLEVADDLFNLRLEDLIKSDDFNFSHDIVGIQNNINRQTKQIENCFVPRFASKGE